MTLSDVLHKNKNMTMRPIKAEMSRKLQIMWDRVLTWIVPCIQQGMWRMLEDQPLKSSVHVSTEVADGPEATEKCQGNS